MRIIRSFAAWPSAAHGSVMALGNFDGMHRGHQAVVSRAKSLANAAGRPCAVMTFEPHPRRFFQPDLPVLRIIPFAQKAALLRDAGVEWLFVARFNHAFASVPAEAFINDILRERLGVAHVVTGENFGFGHKRSGNADYLRQQAAEKGFGFDCVAPVGGDAVYSSTAIRDALKAGDMEVASRMLGRPYSLSGPVIHGDARGAAIGFPTANLRPAPLFLPAFGVYAVQMRLADGRAYEGVANLGVRPTVDGEQCLLEVHCLDTADDMYGAKAAVEFLHFIRSEQRFEGLDALKAQIARDKEEAMMYFGKVGA